ncbi:MAG TPA: two-component regulator propeller domain-containing protein [Acidobacteriota bacterium]|nr:two-component regulator propeller domain-containing protein [Acidobacteriota bacterium]
MFFFSFTQTAWLWGSGLDPAKHLTQYSWDVWHSEDGLPQDSVRTILQSSDGYLWLGTHEGLARFDGASFSVFNQGNSNLPSNSISSLCETPDSTLWIGTSGGLVRRQGREMVPLSTEDGLSSNVVEHVFCSLSGDVWAATSGGGVSLYRDGRFQSFDRQQGLGGDNVLWIAEDPSGTIWAATQGGYLNALREGMVRIYGPDEGLPQATVRTVLVVADGSLWIGTQDGLFRRRSGGIEEIALPEQLEQERINVLYQDKRGAVWIGTSGGLARYFEGRFEVFTTEQGLSSNAVRAIFEDREGSLWLGTHDGLFRFKDGSVTTFSRKEGLPDDLVWGMQTTRDGGLWVATDRGGVALLKDSQVVQVFDRRHGLGSDSIWTLLVDRQDRLWVGTAQSGVYRLSGGRFRRILDGEGQGQILTLLEDRRDGSIWAGTSNGLLRLEGERIAASLTIDDGLPSNEIWTLHQDSRDQIWIGTRGGGLARYDAKGAIRIYTEEDGLRSNSIFAIHEERDGTLWIATDGGGLSRLRQGRFDNVGSKEGLFGNVIFSLLDDDRGRYWMSTPRGIFSVDRQRLHQVASGQDLDLSFERYDKTHGMKAYHYIGTDPSACKTRDGRLWFATQKGVSVIDPDVRHHNKLPPPVVIERLLVNGEERTLGPDLVLPPGSSNIEIEYTALSFLSPSRVRFRYKMSGLHQSWTETSERRTRFDRLPPGRYNFQLVACNNDGVWTSLPVSLSFGLQPHFYQTRIFLTLAALLIGLAAWAGIRLRVRGLRRRNRILSQEIHERKRAEKALRRSEERFRSYFEMPLIGFAITSPERRFIEVNERLCQILGYSRRELQDLSWPALIHPDDRDMALMAYNKLQEGELDSLSTERRYLNKEGKTIHVKLSTACVRREDGSLDHFVDIVQDLTESKRLEQQLRDSRKMEAIGRLAGGVAHDFNNILTVISGYGQLLRSAINGDKRLRNQVDSILDASQKAENLTRQLLAFSRRQVLDPRILDLNKTIREMKNLLKPLIGEDIRLTTRLCKDLEPVKVDAGQIQQVLMNLAVNARDAMPDGGTFHIETGNVTLREGEASKVVQVPAGDYVLVTVRDSGCGMDSQTQERAFEPFYTTKGKGKGTGLGLATVYGIVKQSEGYIFLDSALEKGTTFRLYFPPVKGAKPAARSSKAKPPKAEGRETILVVEDDDGIRQLIAAILSKKGYQCLEASNGTAALEKVEGHRGHIDLLLTDVVMPGINGKELARRLSSSLRGLKVVFMSGYTEDAIDRHGVLEPGTHFLQKPFTPASLVSLIREILDGTARPPRQSRSDDSQSEEVSEDSGSN